jgi:hypothetical protein
MLVLQTQSAVSARAAPAAALWMCPDVNSARQDDVKVACLLTNVIYKLQQQVSRTPLFTVCHVSLQVAVYQVPHDANHQVHGLLPYSFYAASITAELELPSKQFTTRLEHCFDVPGPSCSSPGVLQLPVPPAFLQAPWPETH